MSRPPRWVVAVGVAGAWGLWACRTRPLDLAIDRIDGGAAAADLGPLDGSDPPADATPALDGGAPGACNTDVDCGGCNRCDASHRCVTWTPAELGDPLVLWLDADVGVNMVGGRVSLWRDRSTHGNHAANGDVGKQPTLTAALLRGHAAITFNGRNQYLLVADSPSLWWGRGAYFVEVVARYRNNPPPASADNYRYGTLFSKQETSRPFRGPALWANHNAPFVCGNHNDSPSGIATQVQVCEYVGTQAGGFNDNRWRVYGAHRSLPVLEVRIVGAPAVQWPAAAVDVSAAGFSLEIGGRASGADTGIQMLDGDIAEMVAVAGDDDPRHLTCVESYLALKYGL